MSEPQHEALRTEVREVYGQIAKGMRASCCAPGVCDPVDSGAGPEASLALGYSEAELASVPEGANLGLGCGNPHAIAALKPGEVVLDLGAGGGFDCFLAARQVGPTGKVVGVDMTPEMIAKARANALRVGATTVEFRLGEIEHLPVADGFADVILSNCVINLSPDKAAVFREAFRVLKAGGRLAISDVVATAPLPTALATQLGAATACIAGAMSLEALHAALRGAGFENVHVQVNESSRAFIATWMPGSRVEQFLASATIEATKPGPSGNCCGPRCCEGGQA